MVQLVRIVWFTCCLIFWLGLTVFFLLMTMVWSFWCSLMGIRPGNISSQKRRFHFVWAHTGRPFFGQKARPKKTYTKKDLEKASAIEVPFRVVRKD